MIISEQTGLIDSPPGSFDIVVHFQTLEHVPNSSLFLAECFRVLKPGGFLLCTLPFFYPYHPVPNDFRRWSLDGLRKDLELAGFAGIQTEKVESDSVTLLTILQLFIAERLGYFWTKPVFVFLNVLGWLTRNGHRGNFHLHSSATARKPAIP